MVIIVVHPEIVKIIIIKHGGIGYVHYTGYQGYR